MIAQSKLLSLRAGTLAPRMPVRVRRTDAPSPVASARPLPAELWAFIVARRKYWLLPALLPLMAVGALANGATIRRRPLRNP